MPPQSFATPGGKIFLHFRPILSPHIFGMKLLFEVLSQIAQTENFYRHFFTNFRYGFDFSILCSNFELQIFKNARFCKNILFYTFFEEVYLTSQLL